MYGNNIYHIFQVKDDIKNHDTTRYLGILDYSFNRELKYFYIDSIFVVKKVRNKGFGKLLINKAIELAKKLKSEKIIIFLERKHENKFNLMAWYERMGFRKCLFFESTRLMELNLAPNRELIEFPKLQENQVSLKNCVDNTNDSDKLSA